MTDIDHAVDPFAEGGALEAAYFMLQELGLPMPPLPSVFLRLIRQHSAYVFTTRSGLDSLMSLSELVDEAAGGEGPPWLGLSHEGYGTNNWDLRYAVVHSGLALFVELPLGGAYTDPEACRADILAAFAQVERLLQADPSDELLVVDHRPRWTSRFKRGGEDWHTVPDALAHVAGML